MLNDLLTELKKRLRVTWDDQDAELTRTINRAKDYFYDITKKEFEFLLDDAVTELLLERCRYAFNNAIDEFENNFATELNRLILKAALEVRANGEQANS